MMELAMQFLCNAKLPLAACLFRPTAEPFLPPHARRPPRVSVTDVRGYNEMAALQRKHISREQENRIREKLLDFGAEQAPQSAYDTAWVAMVPAQGAPHAPCFPQCVEWILQNQHVDGSWGLAHLDPSSLAKDAVCSTLACILALKKWNVGDEHIRKGLRFIGDNSLCITDEKCGAPVGFNIILPGLLGLGTDMGLVFPLTQSDIDDIFRLRDMELQRNEANMAPGRKAYMAYIAEGLGALQDWDKVLKYQRKNGSLFNSPSTTAAATIHNDNAGALTYLDSLVNKFGSSVPTAYPVTMYSQLCMVDTLDKMGISHYFSCEINTILDMICRSWLQNDEDMTVDMETCAMAFRMLRMHRYDISSDVLAHLAEESSFHESVQGYLNDSKALLELYKASQVRILEDGCILENIGSWTAKLLKQQLCSDSVSRSVMPQEVEYALKFPFFSATMEPLEHKRNIEHFNTKGIQLQKSAYIACHATDAILALAIEEFHSSQTLYRRELEYIESWVKEVKLDQLEFVRMLPLNIFFFIGSSVFPYELSDARIAWIQNCVLSIAVDDFFDIAASGEEIENFVALIEKWDAHNEVGFCSQNVEVLFYSLYNTVNQMGAKAAEVQKRKVTGHIAQLWLVALKAQMTEAEWKRNKCVPTMEEYMLVAAVTANIAVTVTTAMYLVGPEIPEEVVRSQEYDELARHMSICVRLLNDLATYKTESSEGKITNAVLLQALLYGDSPASVDAAKEDVGRMLGASRMELLRLVVRDGGSVPRACREVFWNTCRAGQLSYYKADGLTFLHDMMDAGNAVVFQPLQLNKS